MLLDGALKEELCCQHAADLRGFAVHARGSRHALPKALRQPVVEMFPGASNIDISGKFVARPGAKLNVIDVVLVRGARRRDCGEMWYHLCADNKDWTCDHVDIQNSRRPMCTA